MGGMKPLPAVFFLFLAAPSLAFAAEVRIEPAFPDLVFDRPVDIQDPRDGSGRLFVVEQAGVIRVFPSGKGAAAAAVFLDIRSKVAFDGNEEGLLGLAFHPDFKRNGLFFV